MRNKTNRENIRQRKNNHTYKIIFTWFGNLPTSTELQGFHYYQGKIQSITCIYNISLSPTRQENTILSSYAAARLLEIISHNYTYTIYIYIKVGRKKDFLLQIGFGQQSWVCGNSSHTRAQLNKSPPWLELIKLH